MKISGFEVDISGTERLHATFSKLGINGFAEVIGVLDMNTLEQLSPEERGFVDAINEDYPSHDTLMMYVDWLAKQDRHLEAWAWSWIVTGKPINA